MKGLSPRNVRLNWEEPDRRHALLLENVEDAEIDGFTAPSVAEASPVIRLRQVRDALIRGCRVRGQAETFLTVEGADTRNVVLGVNDLNRAKGAWEIQPDVSSGTLRNVQQPVPVP